MRVGALSITASMLLLLATGCATRLPSQRGWSIVNSEGMTSLAYGRRSALQPDFVVICDTESGVSDLVYHVGQVEGLVRGARTELLIGYEDTVDNLPAQVDDAADGIGLTVVARTLNPPSPVADWVGKQVTVGAVGRAATLTVPPDRRMIATFLKACRTDQQ